MHQSRLKPSSTPPMADTAARLRYAGEERPVAVKQKVWEDSVAHPKHARAERGTRGATEKHVVDHCRHGGVGCHRRWRSNICIGGMDQSKVHRAPEQHGKDETRLERLRKLPKFAGHEEASSAAMLPAVRKKDGAQRNSTKSGT